MTTSEERQQVLHMIAAGKITPEEGSRLLAALSGGLPLAVEESSTPTAQTVSTPQVEQANSQEQTHIPEQEIFSPPPPIDVKTPDTRHWWQVPFWIGAATLVAGAFVLAGSLASGNVCWVLLCGLPLLLKHGIVESGRRHVFRSSHQCCDHRMDAA